MDYFGFFLILFITFLGSIVHGITGFGFSLVVMGLFTMFLPIRESTLVALALNKAMCFSIVFKYRSRLIFKEIFLILSGGLIGSCIGYFVLANFGESLWLKKYLGLVMILMVLLMYQTNGLIVLSGINLLVFS